MRLTAIVVFVLVLAACGGGDDSEQQTDAEAAATASETSAAMSKKKPAGARDASTGAAVKQARRPRGTEGLRVPARRARIVAKESDFGRVLFDANGQVVYVFEPDRRNRSNCTSAECVKAWPPVLTRQAPSAGEGVNAGLLGTLRRRDGSLQVTYGGRPLYFYEHEAPGEIKCHNVDLHGGLWWVVTPQGDPAS